MGEFEGNPSENGVASSVAPKIIIGNFGPLVLAILRSPADPKKTSIQGDLNEEGLKAKDHIGPLVFQSTDQSVDQLHVQKSRNI